MAYINVPEGVPGIRSLAMFRPETAKPLYELAQVLLRGESPLTAAEREIIAAHVSNRNTCKFCRDSHAAAARALLGENDSAVVDDVIEDVDRAELSDKMRALLHIAGKVQILGKEVTPDDITKARDAGAGDRDIHDTVLIAAAFLMFNRYVDGLASFTPDDPEAYREMGLRMAKGYIAPPSNQNQS